MSADAVEAYISRGAERLQAEDFDGLSEVALEIERHAGSFDYTQQQRLKEAVVGWISAAVIARANCVVAMKRLRGGRNATQAYTEVSSGG